MKIAVISMSTQESTPETRGLESVKIEDSFSTTHWRGSGAKRTTAYSYDALGRLLQAKEGSGLRSKYAYNLNGSPVGSAMGKNVGGWFGGVGKNG